MRCSRRCLLLFSQQRRGEAVTHPQRLGDGGALELQSCSSTCAGRWGRVQRNPAVALMQRRVCRALGGPEFLLPPRFAETLNVSAMALVYATLKPIYLPIVAVMLAITFWSQLAELLYVSKRPAAQVHFPPPCLGHVRHRAWALCAMCATVLGPCAPCLLLCHNRDAASRPARPAR